MSGPFAVDPRRPDPAGSHPVGRRRSWVVVWLPGLAVALGAAVATAHGLYEVAVAARVPGGIAWIYPLITDGLALVAYAATARLHGSAARYAWVVVVLAAGLSGLAQASFLASDPVAPGATLSISAALRFGVGAWPAVAAAIVAHLLYLLATHTGPDEVSGRSDMSGVQGVRPYALDGPDTWPSMNSGQASGETSDPAVVSGRGTGPEDDGAFASNATPGAGRDLAAPAPDSPVRDRARTAAARHATRHGALPTVRELMTLADVSRGTAADALKQLREHPQPLQLVTESPETRTQT